jgi:hypothetical protein
MQALLINQAKFLLEENKNPIKQLKEYEKYRLYYLKHFEVNKVMIDILKKACENCKKLQGKAYAIDDALASLPIPSEECKFEQKPGNYPYICCRWIPQENKI